MGVVTVYVHRLTRLVSVVVLPDNAIDVTAVARGSGAGSPSSAVSDAALSTLCESMGPACDWYRSLYAA